MVMRTPLFVVLCIVFIFIACTKITTTDIGSGLIPTIDGVIVKDTFFDVITNNFEDSSIARIYKGDDHVIGVISNDPLFGTSNAATLFELKPTIFPFSFPGNKDSLIADSVVLVMSYKGVYGDSTMPQTWNVFEINQSNKLKFDSAYGASNNILATNRIGTRSNFDIRSLDDSIKYGFELASNQIRIRLESSFATRLIKTFDSTNAYASDSAFRNNFAGFAVIPGAGSGNALIRINLLDTNTKLAMYYSTRVNASTKRDTGVSYLRFNLSGGSFTSGSANIIRRFRAGSQLAGFLNTGRNDSLLFLQTSPGTFATIRIPNLNRFRNVVVHRAELEAVQAPHNPDLDAKLAPPRYMLLCAYDSVTRNKINVPNDYEITQGGSNIATFGGFVRTRGNVAYYSYTLTRYVQGIVTRNDKSYTLRLYAPSNDTIQYKPPYPFGGSNTSPAFISPASANTIANGRVRLFGGGTTSTARMRLRIIYSDL